MSQNQFPDLTPQQLADLQARFEAIRPQIETHGRIYFRHLCAQRRVDLVAEMVALGWLWFVRLWQRGKDPRDFLVTFNRRLDLHVRAGRRICGKGKTQDVLSSLAQQRHGFVVQSLPPFDTGVDGNEAIDALRDNTKTPPPDQAQFRLDFPAWVRTYTERNRNIIRALMRGERTADVARTAGTSAGRISQLRREFCQGWHRFCGGDAG